MTDRARKLIKLMNRLVKQEHLYSDEQLRDMKKQLRIVKEELAEIEAKNSKGFGKK